MRSDGRRADELRPVRIVRNFIRHAEGSVLISMGDTKVICTATIEDSVPPFLRDSDQGWITAEYGMLPRSTHNRIPREATRGRTSGRTQEIQRLIGRSLRSVVDLEALGSRTIWLDCDVIQADGGTRTASITGSFVALHDALRTLVRIGKVEKIPLEDYVAATSVGILEEESLLDLNYQEDSLCEVDMNIVMTSSSQYVEIQGTAERSPFGKRDMERLLALAEKGIKELIEIQKKVLEG